MESKQWLRKILQHFDAENLQMYESCLRKKLTHKRATGHLTSVMCNHIVLGHVDTGLCSDCEHNIIHGALHFNKKFLYVFNYTYIISVSLY